MRTHLLFWMLFTSFFSVTLAQERNLEGANLFFEKCISCHHPKGSAPFSLATYPEIARFRSMIMQLVQQDIMPPWQPDPHYQQYENSRQLDAAQKEALLDWVAKLKKNDKLMAWQRLYKNKKKQKKSDFIHLKHPEGINVAVSPRDTIIPFEFSYTIPTDQNIVQIEFYCSNISLVHHANYFVADEQKAQGKHATVMNENFLRNNNIALGYAPGNRQLPFAQGCGFVLPKSGKVVGDIHLSPSFKNETIQFGLRFYTSEKPLKEIMFLQTVPSLHKVNYETFTIAPDSIQYFKAYYSLHQAVKVRYTHPHMHVFGKQFLSYAVLPQNDTIPLIKINDWRFWEQQYYQFKNPIYLPKGTKIFYEALYDNTLNNPLNPFRPTIPITEGWSIHQEMMANFLICTYPPN